MNAMPSPTRRGAHVERSALVTAAAACAERNSAAGTSVTYLGNPATFGNRERRILVPGGGAMIVTTTLEHWARISNRRRAVEIAVGLAPWCGVGAIASVFA